MLKLNYDDVGRVWGPYKQIGPSFLIIRDTGSQNRRVAVFNCTLCDKKYVRTAGCNLDYEKFTPTRCPSCASKVFSVTHGGTGTKEFSIWTNMVTRCRPDLFDREKHKHYAGRGIRVCDRWLGTNGFACFLDDMGPIPGSEYSIDRIDVNGNYCPENCRWITRAENAGTRRDCRLYTINGKTKALGTWCAVYGVPRNRVDYRLSKGLSIEEALTRPSVRSKRLTIS